MSDMQNAAGGPADEEAGRLVGGRYRLVEPIGRGARSRIWHGHDEAAGRDVAVEEFRFSPAGGKRRELLDRMANKAHRVARLHHPGIATVLEVIEDANGLAVVTEFYPDASPLEEVSRTPLPVEEVTRIGAVLLDALHAAHSAGIVHGSLNPRGVLLAGEQVVITDFVSSVLPHVPGRFLCPAPEVLMGRPVTPASDMWSLGAVLYQAVEGHPPFEGPTLSHVLHKAITAEKTPARRAGTLAPLLDALLVKDPALRPLAEDAARYLLSGEPLPGAPGGKRFPSAASSVRADSIQSGLPDSTTRRYRSTAAGMFPCAFSGAPRWTIASPSGELQPSPHPCLRLPVLRGPAPSEHRSASVPFDQIPLNDTKPSATFLTAERPSPPGASQPRGAKMRPIREPFPHSRDERVLKPRNDDPGERVRVAALCGGAAMLSTALTSIAIYVVRYGQKTDWTYGRPDPRTFDAVYGEPGFVAFIAAFLSGLVILPVLGWLLLRRSGIGRIAWVQLQAVPATLFLGYTALVLTSWFLRGPAGAPALLVFLCVGAFPCYAAAAVTTDHRIPALWRLCAISLPFVLLFAGCAVSPG